MITNKEMTDYIKIIAGQHGMYPMTNLEYKRGTILTVDYQGVRGKVTLKEFFEDVAHSIMEDGCNDPWKLARLMRGSTNET